METVKVKIAVSVDPNGNWNSAGWSGEDVSNLHKYTVDILESGEARYWLECELPIPEVKTISPVVSEAK